MDTKKLKVLMRKIKTALLELEQEAMKEGIPLTSSVYDELVAKVREGILKQEGYTIEEYRLAKDTLEANRLAQKTDIGTVLDKVTQLKGEQGLPGKDAHTPTNEELLALIKPLIPPTPKDGHTPTKEEVLALIKPLIPKVELPSDQKLLSLIEPLIPNIDLTPINDAIVEVKTKVDSIKIPEPINVEELKNDFQDNFSKNFKKNIDILGMPDFRKLAMGLREDVDRALNGDLNVALSQYHFLIGNSSANAVDAGNGLTYNGTTLTANALSVATTATIITSLTTPILIGGTATTSTLTLQSTSGAGTSASLIKFLTGNNGGTENARMETLSVAGGDGTGGTISHSGGNTIHKFLLADSGTAFTPPGGVTSVTYLVVAGGGGGATSAGYGGGGGAGGLLAGTQAVTPGTPYTITVGDGGTPGNNGGDSSIAALVVSSGGGKGGNGANGSAGGSGGGGAPNFLGGAGTAGQGNDGADAVNNGGYSAAGGGGGASHVGYQGVATPAGHGGNGGEGTSSSITGSAVTYAGGGGGAQFVAGGTGGPGGGGAAGKFGVNGTAGTDNTGGGGGGGGAGTTVGGKGGSGIVYISYVPGQTTSPALGIKQTSPTALLHLGAGTASASTAPLKFTSGTNLTTAEAGAMEFDGTNLYFTPSTVRNTILIGSSSALVYKIGGTVVRGTTEGTNHLDIFNGTAPAGTLANGVSIYSDTGYLKSIDAAGLIGHIVSASAVNTVSPTVPNRTLTVNIAGTTLYIHCKTTND